MAQIPPHQTTNLKRTLLSLFFFLAGIEGIFALIFYWMIPTEKNNAILLGLSMSRLIWMGWILILALVLLWLAAQSWRKTGWVESGGIVDRWIHQKKVMVVVILSASSAIIGNLFLYLLGLGITEPFTRPYFIYLQPLNMWLMAIGLQAIVTSLVLRYGRQLSNAFHWGRLTFLVLLIFGIFLLVWGGVAWTRSGLVSETVGWNRLGTPILETQVLISWGIGMGYIGLGLLSITYAGRLLKTIPFRRSLFQIDLLISLVLWLGAALYWYSIPLKPNWFASQPQPPNFEWYPNSDASVYDITAQNALIGSGYRSWESPFAVRPLFALFLNLLHSIAGPGYEPILGIQIAVLALFPVFLYWIARKLHNRLSALIFAGLIILREGNAIALADVITVSHAKLLMSDLPAALGVSLFALLVVSWLDQPGHPKGYPLIAGGVLGAAMLIRPEVGALFLVPLCAVILFFYRQPVRIFGSIAWLVLGVFLVLSPWVWRNWQVAGRIFLDTPNFRADLIAQRYNIAPAEADIQQQPKETSEEFNQRMQESAAEFTEKHPSLIPRFILDHYMNSQIQMALVLPATFRLFDSTIGFLGHKSPTLFWEQCCSAEGYVRRLPFWWSWDGHLLSETIVPLVLNLLMIAVGIGMCWTGKKWVGLVPFAISLIHLLVNSAFRNSGGRYILPVDWVGILYFSIGMAHVSQWGIEYFTGRVMPRTILGTEIQADKPADLKTSSTRHERRINRTHLAGILGLILFGLTLPLSEKAIPPRYSDQQKQEWMATLLIPGQSPLDATTIQVIESLLDKDGTVLIGRSLYPRFHRANGGESGSTWPSFYPKPYPRLSFYLVGPTNRGVVLPFRKPPQQFEHASDVLVIGCQEEQYLDALVVIVLDPINQTIEESFLRNPLPEISCPLVDPE